MSSMLRFATNFHRVYYQPNILKMKNNSMLCPRILFSNSSGSEDMGSGHDDMSSSVPSLYNLRKYSHNLPANNVPMCFPPLPNIPTGIFRRTDGEVLGLGAGKSYVYKNPEYFSYHHMTFYDMHMALRCFRQPSPRTGRKP